MPDLKTNYLGLKLNNPLIVSSSGLTNSVDKIKKLEQAGAGAVVLKSLFEEQIRQEAGSMIDNSGYPEASDYINNYLKNNTVEEYIKLIKDAKSEIKIPVIASINCVSVSEWVLFAKEIESAGADALELNVFYLPTDLNENPQKSEALYYELIEKVKSKTKLPIAVKIGPHFTNILHFTKNLGNRGAAGIVLFNRFYTPDIDIDNMKFISSDIFSNPADIRQSLRWVGIISGLIENIDIAASTGVHDGKSFVKQILAGAKAVQVCSVIYKNGVNEVTSILDFAKEWMKKNHYTSIEEIRGKMNYKKIADPGIYERSQFMKYFSNYQE